MCINVFISRSNFQLLQLLVLHVNTYVLTLSAHYGYQIFSVHIVGYIIKVNLSIQYEL